MISSKDQKTEMENIFEILQREREILLQHRNNCPVSESLNVFMTSMQL